MPTPFRDQYARARARVMGCYSGGIVPSACAELRLCAHAPPPSEGQSNGLRSAKQARAEKAERGCCPSICPSPHVSGKEKPRQPHLMGPPWRVFRAAELGGFEKPSPQDPQPDTPELSHGCARLQGNHALLRRRFGNGETSDRQLHINLFF
jgi:hypothetical protein